MLKHLNGIKWVGDLSLQDADLLAMYGRQATRVLEHGCGGSTMILAQTAPSVVSYENVPKWKDVVEQRLSNLNLHHKAIIIGQNSIEPFYNLVKDYTFDLAFIDGEAKYRVSFIKKLWNTISDEGYVLFHDTRRDINVYKAARKTYRTDLTAIEILKLFPHEVGEIVFNVRASDGVKSNITIIKKEKQPVYEDWQRQENKPKWAYGSDRSVVDGFWEITKTI